MSKNDDCQVRVLLEAAKDVQSRAYAPYSNFRVGAALITESGKLYKGCNVENTSYGLTICAERNAIFQMVADGEKKIDAILVIGDTQQFLPPCGACRQVLSEFSSPETRVYMCNSRDEWKETTMKEVLPFSFFLDK